MDANPPYPLALITPWLVRVVGVGSNVPVIGPEITAPGVSPVCPTPQLETGVPVHVGVE